MKKRLITAICFVVTAICVYSQTPVTNKGQIPPHTLRIRNGYFGQMLGIKSYGDGDSLFGLIPVYYLGDSTLKVGAHTVTHSGNLDGDKGDIDVSGSGSVWTIDTGAVNSLKIQDGSITTTDLAFTPITGTMIENKVQKAASSSTLTDSQISDDGTSVTVQHGSGDTEFNVFRASGALVRTYVSTTAGTIGTQTNHQLDIMTNNTARARFSTAGKLSLLNYGSGTFTGTTSRFLTVESGGGLVEKTASDMRTDLDVMQNSMATNRILGRLTSGTGQIEQLTGTQVTSMLDVFTSSDKGVVPASGGGTTNFLRADGTWAAPAGGVSGSGGVNRVAFWKTASTLDDYQNFVIDTINNGSVSIGTTQNSAQLTLKSSQPSASLGAHLISNYSFDSDLSGWTIGGSGTGWVHDGAGNAHHVGSDMNPLQTTFSVTAGVTYALQIVMQPGGSGRVVVSITNDDTPDLPLDAYPSGSYQYFMIKCSTSGTQTLSITPFDSTFSGRVALCSVQSIIEAVNSIAALKSDNSVGFSIRTDLGNGIYIGTGAGKYNVYEGNSIVIGNNSLSSSPNANEAIVIGSGSVDLAGKALRGITIGSNSNRRYGASIVIGSGSASSFGISTSYGNTIIGTDVANSINSGIFATACGYDLLTKTYSTVHTTTIFGSRIFTETSSPGALLANVAVGYETLKKAGSATGVTSIGSSSMVNTTSSSYTTAVGFNSGGDLTTGSYNTFLGAISGGGVTTGSNNTVLGGNLNIGNVSNVLAIGSYGNIRIYGDGSGNIGIGNTTPSEKLHISGNILISNVAKIGGGSVSSPSLQHSTDSNTGVNFHNNDTLSLVTSGSERITVLPSGQVRFNNYTTSSSFTGTVVAELGVTSTGNIVTYSVNRPDTVFFSWVAVHPGTTVSQSAGTDFYDATFLVPEHLDGYAVSRIDYALTTNTSSSGSLTLGWRQFNSSNSSSSSNNFAVTFESSDVRKSYTGSSTIAKNHYYHLEVHPSISGTLDGTVQGLLVTMMLTKS